MDLNVAEFMEKSKVNGPGTRAVLWLQGCSIHCEGCFNKDMWSFEPKKLIHINDLADKILKIEGIQGVTFSGGEPFAQAAGLVKLAEKLQENHLNILIFTGYTLSQIKNRNDSDWIELLEFTDILVAGPYVSSLSCDDYLVSSKNQEIIYLSDTLKDSFQDNKYVEMEFSIQEDGTVINTGLRTLK